MAMESPSNGLHIESSPPSRCVVSDEVEKGRVGEVLQQFQIHEDTALAYKMQSKEIEIHVSRNREQRKSVRDNVKTAKQTYLQEVKSSGVLPETSVAEIEQKQWLAEELHRRVEEQESMTKADADRQRQKDEEIALQIQHDEEKQLRYLEHKRHERSTKDEQEHKRLRQIMKDLKTCDKTEDYRHEYETEQEKILLVQELPENNEIITLADGTVIDAKQNQVQTEEQKKQHLQKRDEELAKVLQKQEDLQLEKQRNMREDFRKAIELQDREIAKHLQRQEKAKAEKRREKMRRGNSQPETVSEYTSSHKRHLPTYHEAIGVDDVEREESRHQTIGSTSRSKPDGTKSNSAGRSKSRSFDEGDEQNEHRRRSDHEEISNDIWIPRDDVESNTRQTNEEKDSSESGAHYKNIAEALDPTFQKSPQHSSAQHTDDSNDRSNNKTAPIVPPVKRKSSKDKVKRDKDCKQQ